MRTTAGLTQSVAGAPGADELRALLLRATEIKADTGLADAALDGRADELAEVEDADFTADDLDLAGLLEAKYDTGPVGDPGGKQNWVDKAGGFPPFLRAVANALVREGHSKQQAIQIAIGRIKVWARGGGGVSAATQGKAAAVVAWWEKHTGGGAKAEPHDEGTSVGTETKAFNPSQRRDAEGQWTDGGGSPSSGGAIRTPRPAAGGGAPLTSTAKAADLSVGDEVEFTEPGPGGMSDPVTVRGTVTKAPEPVSPGSRVVKFDVDGQPHKLTAGSPVKVGGGGASSGDDDPKVEGMADTLAGRAKNGSVAAGTVGAFARTQGVSEEALRAALKKRQIAVKSDDDADLEVKADGAWDFDSADTAFLDAEDGAADTGGIQYKEVGAQVIDVDRRRGIVTTLVSVTGIEDRVKDVIHPGAYAKTLSLRKPKGVWSHDWNQPISKTLDVKELLPGDPGLPKTMKGPGGVDVPWPAEAGALWVKTQFNLLGERGKQAFADVVFFGDEQEWSIGYQVPQGSARIEGKSGVRHIEHLDLYEYSPVLFGAMPSATTLSVKSAQTAFRALITSDELARAAALRGGELETKTRSYSRDGEGQFASTPGGGSGAGTPGRAGAGMRHASTLPQKPAASGTATQTMTEARGLVAPGRTIAVGGKDYTVRGVAEHPTDDSKVMLRVGAVGAESRGPNKTADQRVAVTIPQLRKLMANSRPGRGQLKDDEVDLEFKDGDGALVVEDVEDFDPLADFEDPEQVLADEELEALLADDAETGGFDPDDETKAAGWAPCGACGSVNRDEFKDGTARCEDCGHSLTRTDTKVGRQISARNARTIRAAFDSLRELLDNAGLLDTDDDHEGKADDVELEYGVDVPAHQEIAVDADPATVEPGPPATVGDPEPAGQGADAPVESKALIAEFELLTARRLALELD